MSDESGIFSNPGGKIKALMKLFFWLLVVASLIGAVAVFSIFADEAGFYAILMGLGILIFGPILAFLLTLVPYAFGELVENSTAIRESVCNTYHERPSQDGIVINPYNNK